jgi:hypothetical protein
MEWDVDRGREVLSLDALPGSITRTAFSPDGHRILAAGTAGLVIALNGAPLDSGFDR